MQAIAKFLVGFLCCAAAAAQGELLEALPEKDVRQYAVEIIIFSYEENVGVGTEIFIPDPPPEMDVFPDAGATESGPDAVPVEAIDASEIESVAAEGAEGKAESPVRDLELIMLSEEEFTLDKVARQFELLDVYEPIMHVGWIQPTYPQEETPPVELRLLGDPPEGLDGSFTLYLSRYLHLVVDLALDAPDSPEAAIAAEEPYYTDDPTYSFGDSRLQHDANIGRRAMPVRYRIQENRIVKNGELRYFDHPKFGVLAKITRIEEEENADNEPEQPLLSSAR